jgi:hypothetical protein
VWFHGIEHQNDVGKKSFVGHEKLFIAVEGWLTRSAAVSAGTGN